MANIVQQLKERLEARRSQNLADSLQVWYTSSSELVALCSQALDKEWRAKEDIGVLLDKTDRKLFQYRNDATDARRALKRYDRHLAMRVASTTQQIYELRNHTASYLIRTRGADPFSGRPTQVQPVGVVNQDAIMEAELKARELQRSLELELPVLWSELERLIHRAKKSF